MAAVTDTNADGDQSREVDSCSGHRSPVTSHAVSPAEIEHWAAAGAAELMPEAARLRDDGHGSLVSFSRKVFIPLTRLCRDVCGYCTFAVTPEARARAYLTPDEVLGIACAGREAGCHEALFTLGDKPELRYRQAREALAALGCATTTK